MATRIYTYDADSNRTALTSYPDARGSTTGTCSTATSPSTYSFFHDQADRLTTSGYGYDLFASETVGATTRTYALGSGPASSWTGNITGIGGDFAAVQTDTGAVTLQLANLHGDVVATVDDSTSATSTASYAESTEFGTPYFPSSAYPRYSWLGAKQRSRDTLSGLTLMGVRLYDPNIGHFLSVDPVPGCSDNPYDYAHQDPYNSFDPDGKWRKPRW
ncbi:RHS repeat-associated core domain-containing protein [Frankia sp. EI5c]|uniref:RHS repeat-associated core domain-containing protein n=1 Tax=Frankia sp. EI5c TaxID=683316 RepID=UPI0007C253CA|nr:RHS repeat-associated core domain-containing protein [Frankia sp. EI5c]OAA27540.1 RHS repeat-associated core domain-containing protein [Frankia sp. EI5c]